MTVYCGCGREIKGFDNKKHKKTKKHIEYIKNKYKQFIHTARDFNMFLKYNW